MSDFVNIFNLRKTYKTYLPDVQDELIIALLDGTVDLFNVVEDIKYDPFKVQQVRLAMKEGLDKDFLSLPAKVIYELRVLKARQVDLEKFKVLITGNYSEDLCLKLLGLVKNGYSIEGYDFGIIPDELVDKFIDAINYGVNIRVLNNGIAYDSKVFTALGEILLYGNSVDKITGNVEFNDELIIELAKYASFKSFDRLVGLFKPSDNRCYVESFVKCMRAKLPMDILAQRDHSGEFAFMPSQLNLIADSSSEGYDVSVMLNPEYSLDDIYFLRSEQHPSELQKKKLKGVL